MIASIIVGVISGVAAFAGSLICFAYATKSDKGAKWLEQYWILSNTNSTKQAECLNRIATAVECLANK